MPVLGLRLRQHYKFRFPLKPYYVSLLIVPSMLSLAASAERRFTIPAVKRFSLLVRHRWGGPKRFIEFRKCPVIGPSPSTVRLPAPVMVAAGVGWSI